MICIILGGLFPNIGTCCWNLLTYKLLKDVINFFVIEIFKFIKRVQIV